MSFELWGTATRRTVFTECNGVWLGVVGAGLQGVSAGMKDRFEVRY